MSNTNSHFTCLEQVLTALKEVLASKPVDADKLQKIGASVKSCRLTGTLKLEEIKFQEILQGIKQEVVKAEAEQAAWEGLPAQIQRQKAANFKLVEEEEQCRKEWGAAKEAHAAGQSKLQALETRLVQEQKAAMQAALGKALSLQAELARQLAEATAKVAALQQKSQ